jgi:hypothetical protein
LSRVIHWSGQSQLEQIFFLWRPLLTDPKDDMLLELAVATRRQSIVTHTVGDFAGAGMF